MLFSRRDLNEYTDSLAEYMPGGKLFASKNIQDSNFRKLLIGMSGELFRANGLLREYSNGIIPDQTVKFIEEWERALGIPDDCFNNSGTIDIRRRNVLTKLSALGVQTIPDFEELASVFGIVVEVLSGSESGITFSSNKVARFTIVINITLPDRFTYTFPIPFGDNTIVLLQCIFSKLKPANCQVIFQEV
jgi:uncharacterized protein YmfQ (DUF2313 family)